MSLDVFKCLQRTQVYRTSENEGKRYTTAGMKLVSRNDQATFISFCALMCGKDKIILMMLSANSFATKNCARN